MATTDWLKGQIEALGLSDVRFETKQRPDRKTVVTVLGKRNDEPISEEYLAVGNWVVTVASSMKAKYALPRGSK